ncbi:L-lysine 6-transaminase precursor [Fodinibius salinus]|uniref:L-lysine-epsilon aminotransferase n=1 Tax=Fodinibius salinus TaxID=860790 RepID=A0A5D3YJS9_9BACT|nr:L-lysine 6-transaminase [Fodinibius salinus]TYP92760.1 L-lysine 6-transaminase precursor [Fodinibius salinus]
MSQTDNVTAEQVHDILGKHILTDGYDMVLDLEKSEGSYLYDARNGDRYLDFFTFFASNPLGMNHPRLANNKFRNKIGKVAVNKPSNSDVYTEEMAKFVDNFDRVGIPDYLPHSFFISGGALAVENALKVAFDWKVQKNFEKGYRQEKGHKVLHFEQAFHGRTGYTMSLTNTDPTKVKYFPKFDWPRAISPAMTYPATDDNIRETVKDEERAIAQAKRFFDIYKNDIACIIIEPIQGEGGDRHFRPEFHQALRDLADNHEALLIYDEVQTGVGLTGKFWAHEHYVKPDILAFGKKAQVCGILASERVDEVEDNCFNVSSRINSTWGGNLVDMVRFGRILQVIEEENLVENAAKVGTYLQDRLQDLHQQFEHVQNPRGKGLFCAIDFPNSHIRDAVIEECKRNKLMILSCGSRTMRFRPPLTVSKEQIDEGVEIIGQSIKTVRDKV